MITKVVQRFLQLQERIAFLEQKYKRIPGSVKLIVVSKGQSAEHIKALADSGVCDFAENFMQEALPKIQELQHLELRWHFIGRIQHNKIRNIARFFDIVHSIADVTTALQLNRECAKMSTSLLACLQVNLENSLKKSGFSKKTLCEPSIVAQLLQCSHLKFIGLMTILDDGLNMHEARRAFAAVYDLENTLNVEYGLNLNTLSMGMTNDYEAAIAAGATWLRLGRAIWIQ